MLCIVLQAEPALTETFIRAHIERLPGKSIVVHGWRPSVGGRRVLSLPHLAYYKVIGALGGGQQREQTAAYIQVFRHHRVTAVLAEYGDTAVQVMDACRQSGVPLIAHFHGYDASDRSVLERHADAYKRLFSQ